MEIITYRGRLYELSIIGDTINDKLVLECWDLSAANGPLFTLSRDDDSALTLAPTRSPIPLDLLEKVAVIAGTELIE